MSDYSEYTNEELAKELRSDSRRWYLSVVLSLLLLLISIVLLISPDNAFEFLQMQGFGNKFIRENRELLLILAALLSVVSTSLGWVRYRYLRGLADRLQALDEG
jgi:hypothetical protein